MFFAKKHKKKFIDVVLTIYRKYKKSPKYYQGSSLDVNKGDFWCFFTFMYSPNDMYNFYNQK